MEFSYKNIEKLFDGSFKSRFLPIGLKVTEVEKEGERYFMSCRDDGLEIIANRDYEVFSIIYHSEGHEGHSSYKLPLPYIDKFDIDIDSVHKLMGEPAKINKAIVLIGVPFNEVYEFIDHRFGVFYSDSKSSVLYCQVTLK